MTTRISIFTVRIMGPDPDSYESGEGHTLENFDAKNQEVVDNIRAHTGLIEEGFNDLLPEGFYAKVEE